MRTRSSTLLLVLLGLAGCAVPASQAPRLQSVTASPVAAQAPSGIIGSNAAALVSQLGRYDLDLREGPARKLQFLGPACVLDAYLYPPRSGAEPVVTHVDARLPDGREMDRASCVAALSARER